MENKKILNELQMYEYVYEKTKSEIYSYYSLACDYAGNHIYFKLEVNPRKIREYIIKAVNKCVQCITYPFVYEDKIAMDNIGNIAQFAMDYNVCDNYIIKLFEKALELKYNLQYAQTLVSLYTNSKYNSINNCVVNNRRAIELYIKIQVTSINDAKEFSNTEQLKQLVLNSGSIGYLIDKYVEQILLLKSSKLDAVCKLKKYDENLKKITASYDELKICLESSNIQLEKITKENNQLKKDLDNANINYLQQLENEHESMQQYLHNEIGELNKELTETKHQLVTMTKKNKLLQNDRDNIKNSCTNELKQNDITITLLKNQINDLIKKHNDEDEIKAQKFIEINSKYNVLKQEIKIMHQEWDSLNEECAKKIKEDNKLTKKIQTLEKEYNSLHETCLNQSLENSELDKQLKILHNNYVILNDNMQKQTNDLKNEIILIQTTSDEINSKESMELKQQLKILTDDFIMLSNLTDKQINELESYIKLIQKQKSENDELNEKLTNFYNKCNLFDNEMEKSQLENNKLKKQLKQMTESNIEMKHSLDTKIKSNDDRCGIIQTLQTINNHLEQTNIGLVAQINELKNTLETKNKVIINETKEDEFEMIDDNEH
jgi:chromosome segregation ATPase